MENEEMVGAVKLEDEESSGVLSTIVISDGTQDI